MQTQSKLASRSAKRWSVAASYNDSSPMFASGAFITILVSEMQDVHQAVTSPLFCQRGTSPRICKG